MTQLLNPENGWPVQCPITYLRAKKGEISSSSSKYYCLICTYYMVERAGGRTTLALLFKFGKFPIIKHKRQMGMWRAVNMLACFHNLNNAAVWFG